MTKPHGSNPRTMALARQRQAVMARADRLAAKHAAKQARQVSHPPRVVVPCRCWKPTAPGHQVDCPAGRP